MERAFLENIKVGDQPLSAPVIDAIMQEHSRGIENATKGGSQLNSGQGNATRAEIVDNGSKTFTQEEVNRIVSERLERERTKGKPTPEDERETALKAREAALDCRDYIRERDYPQKFLEILDTSDFKNFQEKADRLIEAFPELKNRPIPGQFAAGTGTNPINNNDPIANAFKPNY